MTCEACGQYPHSEDCANVEATVNLFLEELDTTVRAEAHHLAADRFEWARGFNRETGELIAMLNCKFGEDPEDPDSFVSLALTEADMDKLILGAMQVAFMLWHCTYRFGPVGEEEGGDDDG